uniref:Uncharacterized protein n=1 Tax=Aegilops tauschii subsp. strangulata TaxID=200361 RepID=A0A452Z4U0_AEGTS
RLESAASPSILFHKPDRSSPPPFPTQSARTRHRLAGNGAFPRSPRV